MARKQKTIHYLYKTTCLITGRFYIGMHSTNNLDDGYMGSGRRLRASIRKHGVVNHKKEILEFFDTRELLVEAEKKAITPEMITDKNCMNLMGGGEGGYVSEEHYQKTSRIGAQKTNEFMWSEENKEKYSKIWSDNMKKKHEEGKITIPDWTNRKHSVESKIKMSDKAKERVGEKNSQFGTCWVTKNGINKKIKKEELNKYQLEGWVKGRVN